MLMKFIDVDGTQTRCILAGDEKAPPVLLIHGVSLIADIWLRNIDFLARDFRVIAVDMLGHGFTRPKPGEQATVPAKVAHLRKLVDTLGLKKFAVSGSSYGALVGAQLYLANRDRVTKLIINGSGSCFNTEPQLVDFLNRIYTNFKPALTVSTPEMWRQRLTSTFYDPASIPPELLMLLPLCYAQPWMAECWETTITTMMDPAQFRPYRILDRLEEIAIESLIVWGLNDKGGIYESAVAAVKRMPQASLVAFENCAHMPMLEHPARYNELVRDFLAA